MRRACRAARLSVSRCPLWGAKRWGWVLTAWCVRLRVREQHDAAVALVNELLERDGTAIVGLDRAAEAVERDGVADLGRRAPVGGGFGRRRRNRLAGVRQRVLQLRRAAFVLRAGFLLGRRLRGRRRGLALAQLDHGLRGLGGPIGVGAAGSFGAADGWRGGSREFFRREELT